MKFKIGDRVRVVREGLGHNAIMGMTGVIVAKSYDAYGVCFDNAFTNGHDLNGKCKTGHGQWLPGECIELISGNYKIVITSDGKTTLARLYEGDKVVKSAEASRHPDDEFDFTKGAEIAFERLMEDKLKEYPTYYSGKVVCVESKCNWWTAGKIYEVVNGKIFDDSYDERFGILDVQKLNNIVLGFAKFIEWREWP